MSGDYNTPHSARQEEGRGAGQTPLPLPRRGVFTSRFLVRSGEFAGKMEKRLHGVVSEKIADEHIRAMEWYVATLRKMGVLVAETAFRKVPTGRGFAVTLFQESYGDGELVTGIVQTAQKDFCLDIFERTLREGVKAIDWKRAHDAPGKDELGFHSSLRNWAVRDGKMYFLDLTPPLRRVDGRTHPLTFLKHIPARFKFIPSLALRYVFFRLASRDSFAMPVMIAGCLASAAHRRPELEEDLRAKTLAVIEECIPVPERAAYLAMISGKRLGLHRRLNRAVRRLFRS